MTTGVLIELRIERAYRERFLHATRLYALHTRNEATKPRIEAQGKPVQDDSWVGAASGLVEFSGQGEERLLRCHTRSRDGENDWLWELSFRFG